MTRYHRDFEQEEREIGNFMLAAIFVGLTLALIIVAFWAKVGLWLWRLVV